MTNAVRVTPRLSRSARRTQLMAAAKTVFVTQGYHAAAMDDIAESARASANLFSTNTFRRSSSCIWRCSSESAAEMVRLVRAALAATTDNHERVDSARRRLLHLRRRQRPGLPADLRVRSARPGRGRAHRRAGHRRLHLRPSPTPSPPTPGSMSSGPGCSPPAWSGCPRSAPATGCSSHRTSRSEEAIDLLSTLLWRGISRFPRQDQRRTPRRPRRQPTERRERTPSAREAEAHPAAVGRRDLDVARSAPTARSPGGPSRPPAPGCPTGSSATRRSAPRSPRGSMSS